MTNEFIDRDIFHVNANEIKLDSTKAALELGGMGLRFPPIAGDDPGDGMRVAYSKDHYFDREMVCSNSVVPSNKVQLCVERINNWVLWEFRLITTEATNDFTVGATAAPIWLGKWPLGFRPARQLAVPILVHKDSGERESFLLVIGPNGDMTINVGDSTLFTSGNKLNIAGGGLVTINNAA